MDGLSCVAGRVVGKRSYKVFSGEDGNIREREDRRGRKVYTTVMFEGGIEVDYSGPEERKKDAVATGERWVNPLASSR